MKKTTGFKFQSFFLCLFCPKENTPWTNVEEWRKIQRLDWQITQRQKISFIGFKLSSFFPLSFLMFFLFERKHSINKCRRMTQNTKFGVLNYTRQNFHSISAVSPFISFVSRPSHWLNSLSSPRKLIMVFFVVVCVCLWLLLLFHWIADGWICFWEASYSPLQDSAFVASSATSEDQKLQLQKRLAVGTVSLTVVAVVISLSVALPGPNSVLNWAQVTNSDIKGIYLSSCFLIRGLGYYLAVFNVFLPSLLPPSVLSFLFLQFYVTPRSTFLFSVYRFDPGPSLSFIISLPNHRLFVLCWDVVV